MGKSKPKKTTALKPEAENLRLLHELKVHQIELEMQNEQLKQTQAEVEAGLKHYTNLYNELYDFAPVGYFTLDREGRISRVNLTGAKLLGMERGKLIKKRFEVFVSSESRFAFTTFLEKVFTRHEKQTCELALQTKGRETLWVHFEAIAAEDGQECSALAVNITQHKQTENALQKSEALLSEAQQVARLGHFEWTAPGFDILWSDELFQIFEIPAEGQVISQSTIAALMETEDLERMHKLDEKIFTDRSDMDYEYRVNLPSGRQCWIHQKAKITYDENGAPIRMMGIMQDITERKQAEEALRESEERLR